MRFHVRKRRGFALEAVRCAGGGVRVIAIIAISYKLLQCRNKAVVETRVHMIWVRDLQCLIRNLSPRTQVYPWKQASM